MREICIVVLGAIQINDKSTRFICNGAGGLSAPISMNKEFLSFFPIACEHAIDSPHGTLELHSCSLLVGVIVLSQRLYHLVLHLFIHCQFYLSDNDHLHRMMEVV